MAFTQSEVSC